MHDTIIYSYKDVKISYTRLMVEGRTYTLSSIESVENRVIKPRRWLGRLLIFGGLPLLFGRASLPIKGLLLMVVGLLFCRLAPLRYAVVIHTASGEYQALVSEAPQDIDNVVSALHVAIAMRKT